MHWQTRACVCVSTHFLFILPIPAEADLNHAHDLKAHGHHVLVEVGWRVASCVGHPVPVGKQDMDGFQRI